MPLGVAAPDGTGLGGVALGWAADGMGVDLRWAEQEAAGECRGCRIWAGELPVFSGED